jgi:hypothetical protein
MKGKDHLKEQEGYGLDLASWGWDQWRVLVNLVWTMRFCKEQAISRQIEWVLACEERFCSIELVVFVIIFQALEIHS